MLYRLIFYVPASHLETVKEAVFEAGAGCYGGYDQCAWQTIGQGQFRPLDGSGPFLGQIGRLERLEEYKVEMLVEKGKLKAVAKALLDAHPYQQPAYGFSEFVTIDDV